MNYKDYKDPKGRYKFYDGRATLYGSEIERGEFVGYTVVLNRPMSSSWIHFDSYEEAMDTIANHVENYDKYVELDKLTSDYLMSEEGKWGRT